MASLLAEKDVLAKLKADNRVTDLVPAAQIVPQDPPTAPAWPFIQPQQPQGLPLNASCVRGATINFSLAAFTRGMPDVTARDHAAHIGDAIEKCLNGAKSILPGVGTVAYTLADVLLLPDRGEPGARQFNCTVRARVLAPA